MQSNILQEFLNLRLLNIGAEDSRLDKLSEACQELANLYAAQPTAALPPLLAAWDPSAGPDSALLGVGEILQKHWPTFRGAFQDEPLTLYRAIVLEGVMRAIQQQAALAIAVKLISANVLPHLNVGQEERILSKIIELAQSIASDRLTASWPAHSKSSTVTQFKAPALPALKNAEPDSWLQQVAAASGPSDRNGVALSKPNPYWSNQQQHWSFEFTDRMAPILADVHDKAANSALKATSQVLKVLGDSIAAKLNEVLRDEQARNSRLNRSNHLLWWRQALYSESAEVPYRKLHAPLVAIHMAFDIADLLPELYPPAVESLLFEAVLAALGARNDEHMTMAELLVALRESSHLSSIEWLQAQRSASTGRMLLLQTLANSPVAGDNSHPTLGVAPEINMSLGDWAIWLLREVKALEALASPNIVDRTKVKA